jgi:2-oxoglutarate dehydrogenase E1 component
MASVMKEFEATSHLFGANAPFVEELYERYLASPDAVDPSWRALFDSWQKSGNGKDVAHSQVIAAFEKLARQPAAARTGAAPASDDKALKVLQYIRAHRVMGSRYSQLDPLKPLLAARPAEAPGAHAGAGARARVLRPGRIRHGP